MLRGAGMSDRAGDEESARKAAASVTKPEEFSPAGSPGDDFLTRNLKLYCDQIAAEPIPDAWMQLLKQADEKRAQAEREAGAKEGDDA